MSSITNVLRPPMIDTVMIINVLKYIFLTFVI